MLDPDDTATRNQRYVALITALQHGRHRLTPQRLAICQYLAASREHPSPNHVHEQVRREQPAISLATVYNTLAVLRDLGEIVEIPGGVEGVRYETDLSPHANLICMQCGGILDLPLACLNEAQSAIRAGSDFELRRLRVDGFGLCPACRHQDAMASAQEVTVCDP